MGDHEGWALLPNGLIPSQEACMNQILDQERWSIAEERTAELIARIQPNQPSEELRNAVADYVQRLIMKCFSCKVFTFGSVPLKTYLPDGDIDLTAFSKNQNLKDTWANEVRIMLENEEKSENAEFHVKEVQYIQAEVKLVKCLVENIVVDISFNQLGGLCTLCFLEEVDHLINQNHLFKRSIILIKAWCYYESRILGAHHGLISTYALETLVLYIFHVFNNSFSGPLEVLYRFLEFFSNFDWENFCVSLWGPVPIRSIPDMTAEPPRKDGGELLLSRLFLNACSSVYAVFPGQESQGQNFVSKHFNVVDPLRTNNNLGRSVSKGNFFRIRSAFAFGAKRLARLLDCPKDDIIAELNQFFLNTWERHGSGRRPDAPSAGLLCLRRINSDNLNRHENFRNKLRSKKKNENSISHESEVEDNPEENHSLHGTSLRRGNFNQEGVSRMSCKPSVSHSLSQKVYDKKATSRVSDQIALNVSCSGSVENDKGQRTSKPNYVVNDTQGRYQVVRTRSSPELLDTSLAISARGRRTRAPETGKNHINSARPEYNRRNTLSSEVSGSHSARSSINDPSSLGYNPSNHSLVDASAEFNSTSNNYHEEAGVDKHNEELSSMSETMEMHQEEQDLVNMMASAGFHGFSGQVQMPMNMIAPRLPFPISPSGFASMGLSSRNVPGMIPGNIPLVEPPWGTNVHFPQGLVSSSLSHYFPGMGLVSNPGEMADPNNVNPGLTKLNQEQCDQDYWNEQETGSSRDFSDVNGNMRTVQYDDNQHPVGDNVVSSSRTSSGSSSTRDQRKSAKGSRGFVREDEDDTLHFQNSRGNEGHTTERTFNLRSIANSQTSSSRSKASSESSWDGTSVKVSKSTRERRGRKVTPSPAPSTASGKDKSELQYEGVAVDHGASQAEDDINDWIPLSTITTEMAERSAEPTSIAPSHIQSRQIPSYDLAQMSVSESVLPIAPMVLGTGSRQRSTDNSGVPPFAFYPTGPPVPFITMLPVYNFAAETGKSEGSSSYFDKEEQMESNRYQSDQDSDSAECLDQPGMFSTNCMENGALLDSFEEKKSDILYSDFNSHWNNLQFGRLCQNPRHPGPMLYQSPVPPMYLQGNFPWDGPGRPHSSVNVYNQLMGYGHRFVPVTPLQPGSNRPGGVHQRYGDEIPRYRGGTGTYLPNTNAPLRDRQSSGNRSHRGNYNYDHNDHIGEREGNWNTNSKPRYSNRYYGRSQSEKGSSRSDRLTNRPWESFPAYQNGPFGSSNSAAHNNGSSNGVHGQYHGPVVMLYSYDQSVGYGSNTEQVEFGSLGPVHISGSNGEGREEQQQQRFIRGSSVISSPDQPSSPEYRRLAGQRKNYELKDEDFPPLCFPNHRGNGNGDGNELNGKMSHYSPTLGVHI